MAKILFIEGVSGVGKSTITIKLTNELRQNGFKVKSYLEFDYENPIDFYSTAYFKQNQYDKLLKQHFTYVDDIISNTITIEKAHLIRYYNQNIALFSEPLLTTLKEHEFCYKPNNLIPVKEYNRVYKFVWNTFSKSINQDIDFYIFDGSLLHHPINDLIRNYDANKSQIIWHINSLISSLNPVDSFVCYIHTENVSSQLNKARASRGQPKATTTQINFWEKRKEIDLCVLEQISLPYEIYDITKVDWSKVIDTLLNRFNNYL